MASIVTIFALCFSLIQPLVAFGATNIISESFGSTNSPTVTNWLDSDGNASGAAIKASGPTVRSGSPTTGHVNLKKDAWIATSTSLVGFNNAQVTYYWRGNSQTENSDFFVFEWKLSTDTNYATATAHALGTTTWQEANYSFPASVNNKVVDIRFRTYANDNPEEAYLDDVVITADNFLPPAPAPTATLNVGVVVVNDDGNTKVASDFPIAITNSSSTPASFTGATSTTVIVTPGAYTAAVTNAWGYTVSASAECAGTIEASSTKSCVITLDDANVAPTITLLGNNPLNLLVDAIFTEPGFTATDSKDGDRTANVIVTGSVDTSIASSTYTLHYNVTDSNGLAATEVTRTVNVSAPEVQNTAPVITLNGTSTITLVVGQAYVEEGATATDTEDAIVTVIIGGNVVDTTTVGTYVITYNATDSGNMAAAQVTRTVNVVAPAPATITVTKVVSGSELTASSFALFLNGLSITSGVATTVSAGTYSVTETNQANYQASFSSDCSGGTITVAAGQTKNCTLTNTYTNPTPIETPNNDGGGCLTNCGGGSGGGSGTTTPPGATTTTPNNPIVTGTAPLFTAATGGNQNPGTGFAEGGQGTTTDTASTATDTAFTLASDSDNVGGEDQVAGLGNLFGGGFKSLGWWILILLLLLGGYYGYKTWSDKRG